MFYFSKTKHTITLLGFLFVFLSFFGQINAENGMTTEELMDRWEAGELTPTSNFEVRENPLNPVNPWGVYSKETGGLLGSSYPTEKAAQHEVSRMNMSIEASDPSTTPDRKILLRAAAAEQERLRDQEVATFTARLIAENSRTIQPLQAQQRQNNYTNLSGNNPLLDVAENGENLGALFNNLFQWGVGIAIVLSIIMIIFGGIQYMTTDAISNKEEGRGKIRNAVYGLLLALGAWLILNTINPAILNPQLNFGVIRDGAGGLLRGDGAGGTGGGGGGTPNQEGGAGNIPGFENFPLQSIEGIYDAETDTINRNAFIEQLNNDPLLRDRFIRLANAEVGGYGDEALVAFYESAMNRASLGNLENPGSLNNILVSAYYEPMRNGGNSKFKDPSASDYARSEAALQTALGGTNYARGRTHAGQMSDSYIENNWDGVSESFLRLGPSNGAETFYRKTFEDPLPWYK